jgi:hypothetical protein
MVRHNMKVTGDFHVYVNAPKTVNGYSMDVIMIHNLYPEYFLCVRYLVKYVTN